MLSLVLLSRQKINQLNYAAKRISCIKNKCLVNFCSEIAVIFLITFCTLKLSLFYHFAPNPCKLSHCTINYCFHVSLPKWMMSAYVVNGKFRVHVTWPISRGISCKKVFRVSLLFLLLQNLSSSFSCSKPKTISLICFLAT